MVATPDQVESVLFGADPATAALAPHTTVVMLHAAGTRAQL
jgi:hypothetical protein